MEAIRIMGHRIRRLGLTLRACQIVPTLVHPQAPPAVTDSFFAEVTLGTTETALLLHSSVLELGIGAGADRQAIPSTSESTNLGIRAVRGLGQSLTETTR